MSLTGQRDADLIILGKLDDESLRSVCQTNKYARKLCQYDFFWKNRILKKYGESTLYGKPENMTFREYYTSGRSREYKNCEDLVGVKHLSQMVIDDFYNPYNGMINARFTRDSDSISYLLLKIVFTRLSSFEPRNMEEETKLKLAIKNALDELPDYRQTDFDANTYMLTNDDKSIFLKLINLNLSDQDIFRAVSRARPDVIRSLKDHKLLKQIHDGFRFGKIPLDILWDELCSYIL